MYNHDYDSMWETISIASRLADTPILLKAAEKKRVKEFLKNPRLKKYSGVTPGSLANFSVERVIQALHAQLDERDAISKKSGEVSSKIKEYMRKYKLNSVLIDSKKHGRILVNLDLGSAEWRQLSFQTNPGETRKIDGKKYFVLKYSCPDKVISSSPLFELFASRKDVWWTFAKKYTGLIDNLHLFLGLEAYEDKSLPHRRSESPIVLAGLGKGLVLIPDGKYKSYRVERTKNVTIKL
jgi:hypothetical protein